jgi:hypothetical protein
VQDTEEADLGTQVFWIWGDRLQGLGRGLEQEIVYLASVLKAQLGNSLWERKHNMKILALQEFGLTLFQPLGRGEGLAFGAMAVPARVVCITLVATLITSLEVTAERRGATPLDIPQHPLLLRGQRGRMRSAKFLAMGAHDIGDFPRRPHRVAA